MEVLRTPDERFESLPTDPLAPNHVEFTAGRLKQTG